MMDMQPGAVPVFPRDDPPDKRKKHSPGEGHASNFDTGSKTSGNQDIAIFMPPYKPASLGACWLRRRYHIGPILARVISDILFQGARK
jgi:hypothetical protein